MCGQLIFVAIYEKHGIKVGVVQIFLYLCSVFKGKE